MPVVCGLKLTHDGGVAVVDGNRLSFSIEAEKVANAKRHSPVRESREIEAVLRMNGIGKGDIDAFVVDGWADPPGMTSMRGQAANRRSWMELVDEGGTVRSLDVGPYEDAADKVAKTLEAPVRGSLPLFGTEAPFTSYSHATGHVCAAYCASPFPAEGRPSLVLVWDGGMVATLYRFDPAPALLRCYGPVLPITGALYPIFATHFEPFHVERRQTGEIAGAMALLPISGKAMAYAALEPADEDAIKVMDGLTSEMLPIPGALRSYMWSKTCLERLAPMGLSDASILASFEEHLFRMLLDALRRTISGNPELEGLPICLSGGCALNIKWNGGLRASGLFPDVFVPPFPNDAGSMVGAASAEMVRATGSAALEWDVFAGPELQPTTSVPAGWNARPCDIDGLGQLLHEVGDPVVFLTGRAELGPRALGHRSIVAPATSRATYDELNRAKRREWYRPVAPVCLEDRAPEIFAPGTRDPFMLFEHDVRTEWRHRIPAVVHLDGSARLQTVGEDNAALHALLSAYQRRSGIPVLCNTSANHPGCGFFPDAASAMEWDETRYVWSDGTLYENEQRAAARRA